MVRDGVANVVNELRRRGLDPRRVGHDSWEARCPVHRGVEHALTISRNQFNHTVLECHLNCPHAKIIGAIGFTNDRVYAETPDWLISQLSRVAIVPSSGQNADTNPDPVETSSEVAPGLHPSDADDGVLSADSAQPAITADLACPTSSSTDDTLPGVRAVDDSREIAISTILITQPTGENLERPSAVRVLARLASTARLFRSADGRFCAQVAVGERLEIYGLRSAGFRDWLIDGYLAHQPEPPSSWALGRVLGMLEAQARFKTGIPEVFIRVGHDNAGHDAPCFLDLGDPSGGAIVIRHHGWQIVDRPTICFRRPEGLLPLPLPEHDGSIDLLRPYVNLTEPDFRLVIAWLTAALRPVGPYPILVLNGEQASGKSTLARILRLLIDPQACPSLALPKGTHDLMATALNGWLLIYENISTIADWLSDCVCQLAFGGGFASRTLFTNDERSVIYAQRPVILVGINDFVVRGDLRDRSVFLNLRPIPRTGRRTESEFWLAFHADYPRMLGGVLDAIVGGLRALPSVHLKELPRMADFAVWGEATSRGLGWGADTFMATYDDNRKEATAFILEDSAVASVLLVLNRKRVNWTGTPLELYQFLSRVNFKPPGARWPKTVHAFGNDLRKIAPQLRLHGLAVNFERRGGERIVKLKNNHSTAGEPSTRHEKSAN
jgi:hypothetical protein